jgi:hypothetical protein
LDELQLKKQNYYTRLEGIRYLFLNMEADKNDQEMLQALTGFRIG